MSYQVIVEKGAQKYLDKLSGKIYTSITAAIEELAEKPTSAGLR
jgi:mRNA-degrading endonuclease RelE of RelBE toxin-antitoxin system